jgi:hypothetical protein
MGCRYPGDQGKAAIELHPVSGKKAIEAADQRDWLLHRFRPCLCRAITDPVLAKLSPRRAGLIVSADVREITQNSTVSAELSD